MSSLPCVNIIVLAVRQPIRRQGSDQRTLVERALAGNVDGEIALRDPPSLELGVPDCQVIPRQREANLLCLPRFERDPLEATKDTRLDGLACELASQLERRKDLRALRTPRGMRGRAEGHRIHTLLLHSARRR